MEYQNVAQELCIIVKEICTISIKTSRLSAYLKLPETNFVSGKRRKIKHFTKPVENFSISLFKQMSTLFDKILSK